MVAHFVDRDSDSVNKASSTFLMKKSLLKLTQKLSYDKCYSVFTFSYSRMRKYTISEVQGTRLVWFYFSY